MQPYARLDVFEKVWQTTWGAAEIVQTRGTCDSDPVAQAARDFAGRYVPTWQRRRGGMRLLYIQLSCRLRAAKMPTLDRGFGRNFADHLKLVL